MLVAAHDEVEVIADKVANVLASDYPADLLELIVASDGSTDGTVEAARRAGATLVLDLPRIGKLSALNQAEQAAVARSRRRPWASNLFKSCEASVRTNYPPRTSGWQDRRVLDDE